MEILFNACIGITLGALFSFIFGIIRYRFTGSSIVDENTQKFILSRKNILSPYINILTFSLLIIGLAWTVYYLVLGIVDPSQTGYATNVSQLIVSVLTVFSIIIAFYQFLKEK